MKHKELFSIVVLAIFMIIGCDYNPTKTKYQEIKEMQFRKDYTDTLTPLGELLKKNDEDPKALYLLGVSNLNLGNQDTAEDNFNYAIDNEKSSKEKNQASNKVVSEYKKVFLRHLGKSDKTKRQKAEEFFVAMLGFNPDPHFLTKLREDLENKGNSRLSKNSFAIADSHFNFLFRLEESSKQRVGQAYLELFNKTDDGDEFKTVVIDRAFEISKKQNIKKAHSDYHCELSKQAPTTEDAIAELEIANESGDCKSELKAMYIKLKQEKLLAVVKKYETQWGPAKKVELTESDKWIETGLINPGDRIKYLSNAEFLFKYEKGDGKFKSAITEPYGARFSRGDMVGDQTPVWFSKLKQKATVYSWIIKNG
ncbi:hypothetical protein KAJ61_05335 [Candidatus Parcubacteria bacterium]|nr:hypothetical protein [Candidatus Parcubacteria bacterium]